jgi:ribose/xylose/arabinose/galactoside ABC-type transport system permease subunit
MSLAKLFLRLNGLSQITCFRLLNNGLILLGLDSSQQKFARGAIIVLAVAISRQRT